MPAAAAPSAPTRRGACPGVLDPMETADGWLVRVRLPAGRITTGQLCVVAEVAERYGSGVVEVTSRANLQLRGVTEEALERVGSRLVEAGLTAPSPAADARRAVVASPLAGHDPTELADTSSMVDAVLEALGDATLPPLPAKFGVVVDGGGHIGVRDIAGTICLGAVEAAHGTVHWQVARDSSLVAGPTEALGPLPTGALVDAVRAAAATASPGSRSRPSPEAVPGLSGRAADAGRPIGVPAHTVPGRANIVAQVFLGRAQAGTLAAIAELATHALAVRTAPGGLALLGVADTDVAATLDTLGTLGLVVDVADARVGITACIGTPGCAAARADTAVAAARLAAAPPTPGGRAVHLAACEKRCGAPLGATVLVADERGCFDAAGTA